MATIEETRAAAVDLLDVLDRAVAIREDALAAAARLRAAVDDCSTPRLMHAVSEEGYGISRDVETDEIPIDHVRDEVRDYLALLDFATISREEVTA